MYCTWRRYIARVEEETVELGEKNVDRERERNRTQQNGVNNENEEDMRRTGLCTYTALKTNEEATI